MHPPQVVHRNPYLPLRLGSFVHDVVRGQARLQAGSDGMSEPGRPHPRRSVTPADGPAIVSLAPTAAYLAANQRFAGAFAPLASPLAATYTVNVTNTGAVDSPYAVLGFLVPPGNGTDGVPLQVRSGWLGLARRACCPLWNSWHALLAQTTSAAGALRL